MGIRLLEPRSIHQESKDQSQKALNFQSATTLKDRKPFIMFMMACIFCLNNINAQRNFPLNREWGLDQEKSMSIIPLKLPKDSVSDSEFTNYSCFKPYILPVIHPPQDKSKSWFSRKLRNESLVVVNDTADKFYLTIDPLFNFEGGMDIADKSREKLYKNTRGFLIRGDIGKKFSFESSFYETQSTFPQYIDNYIASSDSLFPETRVVPGQGRSKVFRTNGYDYSMAQGYISYSPSKFINIQAGHGKHFIGDGYRSLLLSDNSYNYPYARITTNFKNIQYTNLYTSFMNMTDGGVKTPANIERLFQKKVGSFQMLTANFFRHLTLGLFQGMIWQSADSTNRQHLNFNTFDPLIGVNTAIYGLHNKNNIILGATFKLKITNTFSLFGQYMLDDVKLKGSLFDIRKKNGYQIGFKYFDAFTIKGLHLQMEYNSVRPYAYAAAATSQSYTHYNQALANPLGANFNEMVCFINYRVRRFFVELKLNYAVKGVDSLNYNFGGNIFKSDQVFPSSQNLNDIALTQSLKTTIMYQDFKIGLLVNPSTNFNVMLGISNRIFKEYEVTSNTRYVYIGIRTSLSNFYYDF